MYYIGYTYGLKYVRDNDNISSTRVDRIKCPALIFTNKIKDPFRMGDHFFQENPIKILVLDEKNLNICDLVGVATNKSWECEHLRI